MAPLTISGNLILASGTLGGSGAISVAGSGSQFSGGTLSGNVTNAGTLTVAGSGTKALGGTLTNTGTIEVTGTGEVAITGTINGGTVDVGTGTNLVLAGSTLNNVTLSGNYQLTGNSYIYIENNLTLNGTLTLGSSSSYGLLYFEGGTNQTLGGSGTVVFSGTSSDDSRRHVKRDPDHRAGNHGRGPDGLRGLRPGDRRIAEQHRGGQPGHHPGRRERRNDQCTKTPASEHRHLDARTAVRFTLQVPTSRPAA